jgi:hypothetical protein
MKLRISPRKEPPGVSRERFPALNPSRDDPIDREGPGVSRWGHSRPCTYLTLCQ